MTEKDMEIQSLRRELKALKDENRLLKEKLLRYGIYDLSSGDLSIANEAIEKSLPFQLVNLSEDIISEIRNKGLIPKYLNPFDSFAEKG